MAIFTGIIICLRAYSSCTFSGIPLHLCSAEHQSPFPVELSGWREDLYRIHPKPKDVALCFFCPFHHIGLSETKFQIAKWENALRIKIA